MKWDPGTIGCCWVAVKWELGSWNSVVGLKSYRMGLGTRMVLENCGMDLEGCKMVWGAI